MLSKSHFEFITCGTHILHIALATTDKVYEVLGFTVKVLCNRISPIRASAGEMVRFN